ncbi:hypothetical protein [Mycobacterium sp. 1081908.1]|uniref:hypothetical protein n=1 Tax=Mycobacterium sp. 1081908.1 TaxID=1834066 RepID=UPI0012EA0D17|nr:hypothetical protein [Mycobacterium sp. 1081908.1]
MASHAQDPGNPMSVAKITGLFAIGAAIIGAIPTSIGLLSHETANSKPPPTTTAQSATTTISSNGAPDSGLRVSPLVNGKLTVSGSAQASVSGMYVLIGPKPSGGYDTGCGNVVDQQWQVEVATDSSWQKYPLQTFPAYRACDRSTRAIAQKFTFQGTEPTTTPAPVPADVLKCAAQFGPSCFDGPNFGPPTVYQPNQ